MQLNSALPVAITAIANLNCFITTLRLYLISKCLYAMNEFNDYRYIVSAIFYLLYIFWLFIKIIIMHYSFLNMSAFFIFIIKLLLFLLLLNKIHIKKLHNR